MPDCFHPGVELTQKLPSRKRGRGDRCRGHPKKDRTERVCLAVGGARAIAGSLHGISPVCRRKFRPHYCWCCGRLKGDVIKSTLECFAGSVLRFPCAMVGMVGNAKAAYKILRLCPGTVCLLSQSYKSDKRVWYDRCIPPHHQIKQSRFRSLSLSCCCLLFLWCAPGTRQALAVFRSIRRRRSSDLPTVISIRSERRMEERQTSCTRLLEGNESGHQSVDSLITSKNRTACLADVERGVAYRAE